MTERRGRIGNKRIAEIDGYIAALIEDEILDVEDALVELLQALKAEREYAERTCEWDACHDVYTSCSEKGNDYWVRKEPPKFCPYCGGKIVEKDND